MKKVFSIVLATAMAMSMAVSAMAIQPRSPQCTECGGSTVKSVTYLSDCPCGSGCGGKQTTYKCTSCGYRDIHIDYYC